MVVLGPRERLLQRGEERLSDAECVALVLRHGRTGETSEQMAQRLIAEFGGLLGLGAASPAEISRSTGVGPVRAAALSAAFGLARRLSEARMQPGVALVSPVAVARVVRDASRGAGRESFFVVLLDGRHRLMELRHVSTGSLQSAPVHPREVFRPAIRAGAAAIVVAHNHPSGDPAPSAEDRAVTERLREVGCVVGIELLDHLVVGDHSFFSFAETRTRGLPGDGD